MLSILDPFAELILLQKSATSSKAQAQPLHGQENPSLKDIKWPAYKAETLTSASSWRSTTYTR